jgi:CubicO group peptidase (beta-lactamase class C family)
MNIIGWVMAPCLACSILYLGWNCNQAAAQDNVLLPRSAPEAQGVSSEQLLRFLKAVDERVKSMHSFMLLRHGYVVAEAWWAPESPETPHVLWSLSKSFTSTAVGMAVSEGKIRLDDRVIDFFPEDVPEKVSDQLKAMRIRDLLTMTTGHQSEPNVRETKEWIRVFLAHPVPHKPGTHFLYNTPATFMQSAIMQKVTGQSTLEYLQPRLFDPLGIAAPKWDTNPEGITLGGYGLYLKTEDIAKFGQLYLQRGKWNGKQLVPEDWIPAATSKQVSNGSNPESDWDQGYGFQFWRCRHNAYRGDGRDGQFCVVMPSLDAVIVMTAKTGNMQSQLNVVWDELLPAISNRPLDTNPLGEAALREFTQELQSVIAVEGR